MRVHVESVWACEPERVWDQVGRSATLTYVAWPLIKIRPVDAPALPERWAEKTTVVCRLYLLGCLPLGKRLLTFESIDAARREIQTRESDPLVHRWDHLIRVQPAGEGSTRYSDSIDIDAGPLTALVWLFAQCFYRYRQRRWRAIVAGWGKA